MHRAAYNVLSLTRILIIQSVYGDNTSMNVKGTNKVSLSLS